MKIAAADRLERLEEYYFAVKLGEIRQLIAEGRSIINLGIGNPDLPPSPLVVDELCRAARLADAHGYQPYRGIPQLREAVANWYQKIFNLSISAESEVLPLIGSKEGIFHISMAFLNPGDRVLVPDPGYPGYAAAVKLVGADPVPYALTEETNWLPDLDTLGRTDLSRVKMMWINYPHMPTGAVAGAVDINRIVNFTAEKGILLCHDNPYSVVLNPARPVSVFQNPDAAEHCIELSSLSKIFHMAGWRVGMMVASEAYINTVMKVKSNIDSGMFKPVQLAAAQALNGLHEWIPAQQSTLSRRQDQIYRIMDLLRCTYAKDHAGLFVWARIADSIDSVERYVDDLLYQAGVFFAPGSVFGANGARYIRASICADDSLIQEAYKRIITYMGAKP